MVRFLKTSELAEMTGMTARALEDDRATGQLGGIPFVRFGRSVRYRIDDVERWSESRRFIGGNECTAGAAGPGGAHDTARRGSTPRPATNVPSGRRGKANAVKARVATSRPDGEVEARQASRWATSALDLSGRDSRERPDGPRQVRGSQRSSDAPPGGMPGNTISAPAGASQHPSLLLSSLPPAGVVRQTAREGRR